MNKKPSGRLSRELKTIEKMIRLYCRGRHGSQTGLCDNCSELHRYAVRRLHGCPCQDRKPTCNACPIHCYAPRYRRQIKEVMRYAGPRMLLKHPLLAAAHAWDSRRRPPPDRSEDTTVKHARRKA